MIYTVTLNPALDKSICVTNFTLDTVNRAESTRLEAGGKGINVSRITKKLGFTSKAIGILGGNSGKLIEEKLSAEGIDFEAVFCDGETRTNLKINDYKNNTFTDINESGFEVSNQTVGKTLDILLSKIKKDDIVVLAGSLPKGANEETYKNWISECKQRGAMVFLDADGIALEKGIEATPFFIKPNIDELSRLFKREFSNYEEIKSAAEILVNMGINTVAVTLGGDGAIIVTKDGAFKALAAPVEVKSTVGAGDSFVAAVAVATENKLTTEDTLQFAVAVSNAKVTAEGLEFPELSLVEKIKKSIEIKEI